MKAEKRLRPKKQINNNTNNKTKRIECNDAKYEIALKLTRRWWTASILILTVIVSGFFFLWQSVWSRTSLMTFVESIYHYL